MSGKKQKTTLKEGVKSDAQKSPAQLEAEAEAARAEVGQTLDAIEHQLSPGEILDQGLRLFREQGVDFGQNLSTQVRNNPLPAVITGVGLAWLMASSSRPPVDAPSRSGSLSDAVGGISSGMSSARSRLGESVSGAKDSVQSAASAVADSGRAGARGAARAGQSIVDASARGGRKAREGFLYLRREQPLALGAAAVAAGALVGGLIPATAAENRAVGAVSDDVTRRVKAGAADKAEEAKAVAAHAAKEAREAARGNR